MIQILNRYCKSLSIRPLFAIAGVVFSAILLRVCLFPHESPDYRSFIVHWYGKVGDGTFSQVFSQDFYNYNPPYLYLLWIMSHIPIPTLYAVKSLSVFFELAGIIVAAFVPQNINNRGRILIAVTLLFTPSLVLNSSMWGQVDSLHTLFLLLSLYCLIRGMAYKSLICLGFAFSIKLQSLFLLPAFFILWIIRRIDTRIAVTGIFIIGSIYFLSLGPAWAAGRSIYSLLEIYIHQIKSYSQLSLRSPNFWQWFKNESYYMTQYAAFALTLGTAFIWSLLALLYPRKTDDDYLITVFSISAIFVPYFLPRMHERYFYPADIFTIILAFRTPRMWWVAALVNFASWYAYMDWTYGIRPFDWKLIPFFNLAALAGLFRHFVDEKSCDGKIKSEELGKEVEKVFNSM